MSKWVRKDPPEQPYADCRRASGKRFRQKRDPNSWESSILTIRSNILLLGMSYPSVDKAIKAFNLSSAVHINHPEPSVEQAIELVRRGILGTIDGRDYARIMALEASNEMLAYTVSKEKGGPYELKRHLDADFCSRTFIEELIRQWGVGYGRDPIRFTQAILDYYWIPSGGWQGLHWKPPFFRDNLPGLVRNNLLHFGDLNKDIQHVRTAKDIEGGDYITSECGVIYLPFCENCLVEVVACSNVLKDVFIISFMSKNQLAEHVLWRATNTISAQSMLDWLGKKLDQEEDYCKVTRQKLVHGSAIGSNHVDRDLVLDIFSRIKDVEDVRMIKLTALRMFHPDFQRNGMIKWPCHRGVDIGGFVGLLKSAKQATVKSPPSSAASKSSSTKADHSRRKDPPTRKVQPEAVHSSRAVPPKAAEKHFLNLLKFLLSQEDAAIEVSNSGAIIIKSLEDLDESLPVEFGRSADFQRELKRFGWKRRGGHGVSGNEEMQLIYHNKARSQVLLSFFERINAAKIKEQSAKVSIPSDPNRPSIESIVNVPKVVLDLNNTEFKEVMYEMFRSMRETKMTIESAILLLHNKLKQTAMQMLDNTVEGEAASGDALVQLFAYDAKQHCIYAVSEEEAIKKIRGAFNKRRELESDWAPSDSTSRRSSRLHNSIQAPSAAAAPTLAPPAVEESRNEILIASDASSLTTMESSIATCELGSHNDIQQDTDRQTPKSKSDESIKISSHFKEAVGDYFGELINDYAVMKPGTDPGILCSMKPLPQTTDTMVSTEKTRYSENEVLGIDSDMSSCKADSDIYASTGSSLPNIETGSDVKDQVQRSDSDISSRNVDPDMHIAPISELHAETEQL